MTIEHEYEVRFILELSNIITLAITAEEDEEAAIAQAEDRLALDGIDIQSLDVLEVTAKKTGEYH
jgi:hypothetical protein